MEVEKAFKRLLIRNPFYGLFALSLPKVITKDIPSLCVSKQGVNCQLNINPDFWEQYSDDEQIALLTHELSHIALQHMFLLSSFEDSKVFNIAADAEVNSYISNLPEDCVNSVFLSHKLGIPVADELGTKAYYELIKQWQEQQEQQAQASSPQKPCNGGQGGQEPSEDDNPQEEGTPPSSSQESQEEQKEQEVSQYPDEVKNDFSSIDDHSTWDDFKNLPEATQQLMQNNINVSLKRVAEQVEKMRGTIPDNLVEIIEKLRKKKPEVFNWKAYFRRMLGSIYDVNIKSTRRKPSKRYEGSPGIQHKKKVSILVAVDTSGSVSKKELQDFFSEIDYIWKAGARITILECDAQINSIIEYDGKHIPEIKGRGGTDFNPPVDYYVEHKKEYASLIYFTDGECSIPKKHPSGMVWIISSAGCHQEYPGKTIYIPKEEKDE